jgi:predicted peptidase
MLRFAAAALAFAVGQTALPAGVHDQTLDAPGGAMTYAVSVPKGYRPEKRVPLVLVLHSGGQRIPHYGREFMTFLAQPALDTLGAVMVAPDCPADSWTDARAEDAVVMLLRQTMEVYAIDPRRVLVVGYSMGGRGAWFMSSRHPDLITAAIPMAASIGNEPVERLGTMPTYIIHSRDDEVSPFAPAEQVANQLTAMGKPVRFEALRGFTHFEMFRYIDALRRGGRWVLERWNAAP